MEFWSDVPHLPHTKTWSFFSTAMNDELVQSLPKISIVMPSFNQAAYLEQAIQSVLTQDYANTELIVMDGGSTDGSVDVLKRYSSKIAHWESAPDAGQSEALNKAFSHVTGDVVGWLNSDDVYTPGTFQAVAKAFRNSGAGIVMSRWFGFMEGAGIVFDYKENAYTDHATLVRFWATNGMTINQPCVFFLRRLVDEMEPVFDPSLHYAMDYDLWLRLTLNEDITVVEGHWANYRFHDSSKSGAGFDKFFPEWYAVSWRYWGKRHSKTWVVNWLHHFYYNGPRKRFLGLAKRLRRFLHV